MPPVKPAFASLGAASQTLSDWLAAGALPVWATLGVDPSDGGFREALTPEGAIHDPRRRARVQARQAFVFATAAAKGVPGRWLDLARRGLTTFLERARRPDGLYAHTLTPRGEVIDPVARLYEHAFILLALSALDEGAAAAELGERLETFRHPPRGFRETDERPFQANALMHLFEAAQALRWDPLADELAALALDRFIDPATGALHEVFDAEWRALGGEADGVEPGHQFEWAWLLDRWGVARGEARAQAAARGLYGAGRRGLDVERGVVVNVLWDDLSVRDPAARLWPQTEFLKAALALDEPGDALIAANAIVRFLDTPLRGVWRERMRADGSFIEEPAPATSLYHLSTAIWDLGRDNPWRR